MNVVFSIKRKERKKKKKMCEIGGAFLAIEIGGV